MKWLENLKEGDRVYVGRGSTFCSNYAPATVERTTKTTVIVDGKKYRKTDGKLQGSEPFFTPQLCEATPERDAKCRAYQLKERLTKVAENINLLSVDQIERILAIVNEAKDSNNV